MKRHLTPEMKIGELRLLFNNKSFKKKICLVEGDSDCKIYEKVAHNKNVLYDSANGKKALIKIMEEIHFDYKNKLFAICDADYCILNNVNYDHINTIMTDHHDSEMLLLNSNAMECFIEEHVLTNEKQTAKLNLLNSCLNAAYEIGLIRWYNNNENVGINFKGLNFLDFVIAEKYSFIVNMDELAKTLILRSNNTKANKTEILKKISEYKIKNACKKQVCSGHDVTNMLTIAMNKTDISNNHNLNVIETEKHLRLAYHANCFTKTELYNKLKNKWTNLEIIY